MKIVDMRWFTVGGEAGVQGVSVSKVHAWLT